MKPRKKRQLFYLQVEGFDEVLEELDNVKRLINELRKQVSSLQAQNAANNLRR